MITSLTNAFCWPVEAFARPGVCEFHTIGFQGMQDHLMVVFLEACPVVSDVQGLGIIGECFGGFKNDK